MGLVPATSLADGKIEVQDIVMLDQVNSSTYTEMTDEAMNKYYEEHFNKEEKIGEFGCVWLHTHPGDSCNPSSTDEETFKTTFGRHPWALMLILGKSGAMYGRIKNNFPAIEQEVDVVIDWTQWESILHPCDWAEQYVIHVKEKQVEQCSRSGYSIGEHFDRSYGRTSKGRQWGQKKDWVDYSTFEESPTGMRSKKDCFTTLKAIKKLARKNDKAALIKKRYSLCEQMARGTLYESEVMELLWLNWWIARLDKNIEKQYPSNWTMFMEQEGYVVEYADNGPKLVNAPLDDTTDAIDIEFSGGILNDDTPKETPKSLPAPGNNGSGKIAGFECADPILIDAITYGNLVQSGGETFYDLDGRLYHPRLKRVMTSSEAEAILSSASSIEYCTTKKEKA